MQDLLKFVPAGLFTQNSKILFYSKIRSKSSSFTVKSDVLEGHLKLFTCDYVMLHASGVNTSVVPFADLIVLLSITSIFGPQYLFYFFLNLNLV